MSEFPETSLSLIARIQEFGDEVSWAEFLRIYQPVVYRIARRRGLQDADAHDAVQQVFVSVSRAIEGWQAGSDLPPFRAWLTAIARNAILKLLIRQPQDRAAGASSVLEMLHQFPDDDAVASDFQIETRRELVLCAAEQVRAEFTSETWTIFWQTAIDGVPIADVAKSTERTPGSIYVVRHRILAKLKDAVQAMSLEWGVQEGWLP